MSLTRSRQIGIFLLLVFTSSLWGESVLAAHNIYQLTKEHGDVVITKLECQDGFAISGSKDLADPIQEITISDNPIPHFAIQDFGIATDQEPEQEKRDMLISNCSSSLQILPTGSPVIHAGQGPNTIHSSIQLLSTQLFVNQQTDPPRIG